MNGKLYLVATPIGNLEDITLRAIKILKEVDLIAAEDTRQTLKLLNHFEISKPLISYYRHNEEIKSDILIEKLKKGENIALVSDAGTPGICDPGEEVIQKAIKEELEVIPIPGACAMIHALIGSGLNTKEFNFLGFLPLNKKLRKEKLEEIKKSEKTIIIYEAPHKMKSTLNDLKEILQDRRIVLARELTKIHEEFIRKDINELLKEIDNLKGEMILIIEGTALENNSSNELNDLTLEEHYKYYELQGLDKKQIIKKIAKDRNVNKNEIYMKFIKNKKLLKIISSSFYSSTSFDSKLAIFSAHFEHTNLSLNVIRFLAFPQKTQFGSYFLNTIEEPSTYISIGSFSAISNLFLISIGITTLPNSSTFLIIPVDFIIRPT